MGLLSTILSAVFSTNSRSQAYTEGNDAYYGGSAEDSNPYQSGTRMHAEWADGYYGRQ